MGIVRGEGLEACEVIVANGKRDYVPRSMSFERLIRLVGKACQRRKEAGECNGECIGIGWCSECAQMVKTHDDEGKHGN